MSDSAPGLSEYEKSVFLTKAQDEIVRAIYNNTFEGNEEMRRCLDVLITDKHISPTNSGYNPIPYNRCKHTAFKLPNDIMYIIIESAQYKQDVNSCWAGQYVPVSPTLYDDLHKDLRNPFRGTTARKVLRIELGVSGDNSSLVELLSKYDLKEYAIRYLRKPYAIVLEDLTGTGLTIEGREQVSEYGEDNNQACELNPIIHQTIIERAVQLAKASYKGR